MPTTDLHEGFSSEGATATSWDDGRAVIEAAEIYWVSTVRADGRPHVTPLIGVWFAGALHFTTGPGEQKAKNLEANRHCILTTGCNGYASGLDIVLEGEAVRVENVARLRDLAAAWLAKYGEEWRFEARDGAFHHGAGEAFVFEVRPTAAFGYARGDQYSQTRWRF